MTEDIKLLASKVRRFGYAMIESLAPRQLRDVNDYFESKPIFYNAHVPQTARNNGQHIPIARYFVPQSECFCVSTDDAILAPVLFERALGMTDVASEYLDIETPVLYSANAFWTKPGTSPSRPDIQELHVDRDDTRFLALFILLTDTDANEGVHELEGPDAIVRPIFGPAGTAFLADTSRRHRGRKPLRHTRGIVWFRWGVSEYPPANRWDCIQPIQRARLGERFPQDPRLQQSIRLLAQ